VGGVRGRGMPKKTPLHLWGGEKRSLKRCPSTKKETEGQEKERRHKPRKQVKGRPRRKTRTAKKTWRGGCGGLGEIRGSTSAV